MAPASVLPRLPEGAGYLAAIITFRYHRQRALDHRRSGEADHRGILGACFDHLDMGRRRENKKCSRRGFGLTGPETGDARRREAGSGRGQYLH